MIDLAALDAHVRAIAAEMAARPAFVHQRNVESVLGPPAREYLRLSRLRAWPSTKERRLVIARTEDVARYFEARIARHEPARVTEATVEATALARVGARRVA